MNSWAQGEGQPGWDIFLPRGRRCRTACQKYRAGAHRANQNPIGLEDGDAVFFCAGVPKAFAEFAGRARNRIGEELELIDADQFAFCWIVDFPMFETDETTGKLDFSHNPFSMPQGGMKR